MMNNATKSINFSTTKTSYPLFKVMADVTDMIHKGTGALISHDFSALYKKEWHKARDSLRATKSDEEIIYILLRIVRVSVIFYFLFYKVRLLPYNVNKICINF